MMGTRSNVWAVALGLLLLECAEAGKSSVEILNWSIGQPLWVNCKSKDDNLGWHKLEDKQSQKFWFHENFWMTTAFYCMFIWNEGENWQSHTVWDRLHDWRMPAPCGNCLWRAEPRGTFLWSKIVNEFIFGHEWYTNGTWRLPPADVLNATLMA